MDSLKKVFSPTKSKLAIFLFIILASSFSLYGAWAGDITTSNTDWPDWVNAVVLIWSFTSIIGMTFQGPVAFLIQLIPPLSGLSGNILFTLAILINSYTFAALIGSVWETQKTKEEVSYLRVYIIGIFLLTVILLLLSVGESSDDSLLIASSAVGLLLVVRFTKTLALKIFKPILILTILVVVGLLGFALSDFEESYCWNNNYSESKYSDHMDCHEKYNFFEAISGR